MSSRGRPSRRLEHRVLDALGDAVGDACPCSGQQVREVAVSEHLLPRRAHLRDAVRVEHDQVAGRELDRDVGEHRVDVGAEQRPELPDRLDGA